MVQQAAHVPMPAAGRNDRSCSSQQVAAAWAWFEHSGATCITPRRAEGIRGAPHLRTTARPASRFKKEFLASSKLSCSDNMGDNPAARQPRRHSFHGKSLRENSSITVGSPSLPTIGALLDGKKQADVGDILGLNGDDHDFDRVGSTLLDKFELESLWRQVRHRTVNGASNSRAEESTYFPSHRLHCDGHESSDNASSFTSQWGGNMRRGGSGNFHRYRPPHDGRSPTKDDRQHGGTASSFLQLIRLGISKSASSPALCSSVATANSIRDHRMRTHPSDQAKTKHQEKLQSSSSPQNRDARIRSPVRLDQQIDGSAEKKELDQHHYHNHRHIHHHHHHHLLHHTGDGVLLEHIRSKLEGTIGTPMLSQKLHDSLEKELLKHPHYYIERNGGGCPQYGYFEKYEGK